MAPADDAPTDRRVDAVVVLRRQVRDEVGAALEARGDSGVTEELVELEEAPPWPGSACRRSAQAALDDCSVGGRDDAPGLIVDRAARPAATGA